MDGSIEINEMRSLSTCHSKVHTGHVGMPEAVLWGGDAVQDRQAAFKELTSGGERQVYHCTMQDACG